MTYKELINVDDIAPALLAEMKKVYFVHALMVVSAALGFKLHIHQGIGGLHTGILAVLISAWCWYRPRRNEEKGVFLWLIIAFLLGLSLGPIGATHKSIITDTLQVSFRVFLSFVIGALSAKPSSKIRVPKMHTRFITIFLGSTSSITRGVQPVLAAGGSNFARGVTNFGINELKVVYEGAGKRESGREEWGVGAG
ncbi:hypothetical protein ACH5RR_023741 [Cinchona calisaya]|uniref:Uncharacterized protein n=1 Tax=Cinchona calisaya TaxID=153742 RepID=A0ABD2ZBJ7_9GENT